MATEMFRPMTPSSFKFRKTLDGTDPDFVNKYQPIWTPYSSFNPVGDDGYLGDFTNYEMTEFTSGNDAPLPGIFSGDIGVYQAVPPGEFNDWVGKGPFPTGGIIGASPGTMDFQFFTEYHGELDPPGDAVHVMIDTTECSNNHRPWIGQFVTMRAKVKTEIWVDYEITETTYRDIEYIHECVSGDFATSPIGSDGGAGYYPATQSMFRQIIEDVDFLEQSVVDGSGTYENFDPAIISIATYPLEYSRTSYFAVEE